MKIDGKEDGNALTNETERTKVEIRHEVKGSMKETRSTTRRVVGESERLKSPLYAAPPRSAAATTTKTS